MRKILTLLTITLTLMSYVSHAQTNSKITGTIVDGSQKIVESSTITLLRAKDSSVAKMSVAGKDGKFAFEDVMKGQYLVSVSAVGHQKAFTNVFEVNEQTPVVNLQTIELIPTTKEMTGVTVVAKKPLVEQKLDRTIVNVEASVSNVGNTALEVLEKSPGVTVDKDGNISLKGKQGVQVYIDGRPSYLSGQDLANLLKSMTASQLEQIEIMTNPPAKYDAAGNSGIINIKTKKNKQFGYNGNITTGYRQGFYPSTNNSVNFNYRNNKVNVFTNLGHYLNKRFQKLDIQRNFKDASTKQITSDFSQTAFLKNQNTYMTGKVGVDYFVTKKTTVGVVLSGYINPSEFNSNNVTNIDSSNIIYRKISKSVTDANDKWKNHSVNANFRHTFDSTGQEISADVDLIKYKSTSFQNLYSGSYNYAEMPTRDKDTLYSSLPQSISIYSAKVDYVLPLKKDAKFEAGVKTSFVKTDNDARYDSLNNGVLVYDNRRSNHFLYNENINAVYVNYSRPLSKKISGQFGLRLENTIAKGKQVTTGDDFKRNYTQLFPTAYLQYTMNEKNSFVLNYGRRIERPDYSDLNPFIRFIDPYTYEQGNPNLKPQFSHNIELSHNYNSFLNTTLNYSQTNDIIQQVIEQNEATQETYIKRANIAKTKQYGLAVSFNKPINKWWTTSVYTNVYYNKFIGIVNNSDVNIGISSLVLQSQQQFKFAKTWTAELSGFFRTKGAEGVMIIKPIGQMNAGLSKQILKGKGTVKLNIDDVLNTNNFKGYSKYGDVDVRFQGTNYRRAFNISFSYRFNKGKLNAGNQRRNGGASDEQNRVKGGN